MEELQNADRNKLESGQQLSSEVLGVPMTETKTAKTNSELLAEIERIKLEAAKAGISLESNKAGIESPVISKGFKEAVTGPAKSEQAFSDKVVNPQLLADIINGKEDAVSLTKQGSAFEMTEVLKKKTEESLRNS